MSEAGTPCTFGAPFVKASVDHAAEYWNGFGKVRRFSLSSGTIEVRRPGVRGLEARYVHLRPMTYSSSSERNDPYEHEALLDEHVRDVACFVVLASTSSRVVTIVPFHFGAATSPAATIITV